MDKLKRIAVIACLVVAVSCDKDKEETKVKCQFDGITTDYSGLVGTWELKSYAFGDANQQFDVSCSLVPSDIRSFVGTKMTITKGDYFNAHIVLCDNEENLIGVAEEQTDMSGKEFRAMFYDENCHPIRQFVYDYYEDFVIIYYWISDKVLFLYYERK